MSQECYCDYDPATIYRKNTRKAVKAHRCSECFRTIEPGESYEAAFGVWDGMASSFHTCSNCIDLRDYVSAHIPCFCWAHGNLIDDAIEVAREYSHEAPGLLFGVYRRRIAADRARRAQK